jgi:hypothetical protein
VLVKRLRQALQLLLEKKARQPALRLEEEDGGVVAAMVDLLNHDEAVTRWGAA